MHSLSAWGSPGAVASAIEHAARCRPRPDSPRSPSIVPARVIEEQRTLFRLAFEGAEAPAELAGRLRHEAQSPLDLPVVGDWVLATAPAGGTATIREVLPRSSLLARKAAGSSSAAQPIAANVETVLIATAAGSDVSLRRLERYVSLAWESGAQPVVVVTKSDLVDRAEAVAELVHGVEGSVPGAPVLAVSARDGRGLDALAAHLRPASTAVLVGSSGVGKSTLINRLIGEDVQVTRAIRESDGRGVHTTTSRRILVLPGGALLVDTPGMREVGLLGDDGLDAAFADIDALAKECRFRDCAHDSEPDCAVTAAIGRGALDAERLESYRKLEREAARVARKANRLAQRAHTAERKRFARFARRRDQGNDA